METKIVGFNTKAIKALEKFKGKDKSRDYLLDIYYNDRTHNISATDGKICAKIDNVTFDVDAKDKLFTVKVISDMEVLLTESKLGYPDVNRIFPNYQDEGGEEITSNTLDLIGTKAMNSIEISVFINEAKHPIDFKYLLNFPKELFKCFESSKRETVLFRSKGSSMGDLSIALMAINIKGRTK